MLVQQIRNYVLFDEESCDVTYVGVQRAIPNRRSRIGITLRNRPVAKLEVEKYESFKIAKNLMIYRG